jgi:hypothetical protein
VVLVVGDTITPSSVTPSGTATITTYDAATGKTIDNGTLFTPPTISGRSIGSKNFWRASSSHPSRDTSVLISFHHCGSLKTGGSFTLALPTDLGGWAYDGTSAPSLSFTQPDGMTADATWTTSADRLNSTLSIEITSGNVAENGTVTFTVAKLRTPRSTRGEQTAWLHTRSDEGGLVHGPTEVLIAPITYGALATTGAADGLAWVADITTPGVTSMANLSFHSSGALVTGSSVLLTLPCGWHMPTLPTVRFHTPSGLTASTATFSATASGEAERSSSLVISLAKAGVSASDDTTLIVSEGVDISLTVMEVTTPTLVQTSFRGFLHTRAPFSLCDQSSSDTCTFSTTSGTDANWPGSNLSVCGVDGPTSISFSATAVATYTLAWHGAFIPVAPAAAATSPPAFIVSDSPSPHIKVRVTNDRGGAHVTGEGTEFADVTCDLAVETINGIAVESGAVLAGVAMNAELVAGVATFPERSFDVPLGSLVGVRAQCYGGDGDDGTFVSVSGELTARSYTLEVGNPAAEYIYGSALSGDPTLYLPNIDLVIIANGSSSVPASAYELGIGTNTTECEVSVTLSPSAESLGKSVILLNKPANRVTSLGGMILFDQLALFAGDMPVAMTYSVDQMSDDTSLSPGGFIMKPLLTEHSLVHFAFNCFWGGKRHKPLPQIGGYSSTMTAAAKQLTSTVQQLSVDWIYTPPGTIQSGVDIGECDESIGKCDGSATKLYIQIKNHSGLPHTGQPLVKCKLAFWKAIITDELVYDEGRLINADPALRPELRGVTQVETNSNGTAVFAPVSVKAALGSTVELRVLCFSSNWLPELRTDEMKVGSIIPKWKRPPPKMILLGGLGVPNTFRETFATAQQASDWVASNNFTQNQTVCNGILPCTIAAPMSIQWWDNDKNEPYETNCARCCKVTINSSYFPYSTIVSETSKTNEILTDRRNAPLFQIVEGAVASVVNGVARFDDLVLAKHNTRAIARDADYEQRRASPFLCKDYANSTADCDDTSSAGYAAYAAELARRKGVNKEFDDSEYFNERIEFRVSCNFAGDKDLAMKELYWPDKDGGDDAWEERYSKVQPVRALMTDYPRKEVKIKLALDDDNQFAKQRYELAMQKQLASGDWVTMGTECERNVQDASLLWCHDKTTKCLAQVDFGGRRKEQIGASIGGEREGKPDCASREDGPTVDRCGRVGYTDLIFSKVKAQPNPYTTWPQTYQFDGIGRKLNVSFICEGSVRMPRVYHELHIAGCKDGEEPSSTFDDCVSCNTSAFKSGESEICQRCPSREYSVFNPDIIRWGEAQSNNARTSCECRFSYMAVRDPKEHDILVRPELTYGEYKFLDDIKRGLSWGHKCKKCPEGAICDKVGITFDSVQAREGYWQDKDYFRGERQDVTWRKDPSIDRWYRDGQDAWTYDLKNGASKEESQISFKKCSSNGAGTSACLGGDYSKEAELCASRPCNCMACLSTFDAPRTNCTGTFTSSNMTFITDYYNCPYGPRNESVDECEDLDSCQGCADHHIGNLCANCEVGYKKNSSDLCEICPPKGNDSMKGAYIALGLGLGFLAVCFFFMQRIKAMIERAQEKAVSMFEAQVLKSGVATEEELEDFEDSFELYYLYDVYMRKVKVFISFFQVVSAFLGNFKLIEWPAPVRNLLGSFAVVNLNPFQAQALACASDISFADVFLISTIYPLVLCSCIVITHLISKYFTVPFLTNMKTGYDKRGPFVKSDLVYKLCLMIIFLVYPATSNLILKVLVCEDFDNGDSYLNADLSIKCNPDRNGEYEQIKVLGSYMGYDSLSKFAYFMVVIYPIGFPVVCLCLLYFNRENLFARKFDTGQMIWTDEYGEGVVHDVESFLDGNNNPITGPDGSPLPPVYLVHFDKLHSVRSVTTEHLPGTRNTAHRKKKENQMTANEDGPFPKVDGMELELGDQILVNSQKDAVDNGIYTLSSAGSAGTEDGENGAPWVLKRAAGSDTSPGVNGSGAFVTDGFRHRDEVFILVGPIDERTGAAKKIELNVTELHYQQDEKDDTSGDGNSRLRSESTVKPLFVQEKVRMVAEQIHVLDGVTNSDFVNEKGHFCIPDPDWENKLGLLYGGYEPEFW